ncbi:MAG: hypothetical protein R3B07_22180 [Polyangiaceae bacterium]
MEARRVSIAERLVASGLCVLAGVALISVAWRFASHGGTQSVVGMLVSPISPLPRAQSLGYLALSFGGAIAVGRFRAPAWTLLLPFVFATVQMCDVATTNFHESMFDARALLGFGVAHDLGRACVLGGLLCAGLTWWSHHDGANARAAEPQ